MSLVRIETYNQDGIIRHTFDQKIIIDTVNKHIIVICQDDTVTPIDRYPKEFIMEITNSFQVPIVDMQGNPVWVNPEEPDVNLRIQRTIGEYDAFEIYNDYKIASIKESLSAAILRKKGVSQTPNVFYLLPGIEL